MMRSLMVGDGKSESETSSPTYVRSSYKVGKTWMLNYKEFKCIIIIDYIGK